MAMAIKCAVFAVFVSPNSAKGTLVGKPIFLAVEVLC
jgi:hypothetical protein